MPAAQQPKIDVANLEKRLNELQKNLSFLGNTQQVDSSDLFKIIHRPGWTTPQQVQLAEQILEAMNQQGQALRGMRNALDAHVTEAART